MTVATGWFIPDGVTVPKKLSTEVRLPSCWYDSAAVMLPLGYFTDGHHTTWIAQLTPRNRERYVVVRADPRRMEPELVLATKGGSD